MNLLSGTNLMKKDRRGFILIASYLVIAVLIILGAAFFSRSITETRVADRNTASLQAFYLAEAGIDQARRYLDDLSWLTDYGTQDPDTGFYTRILENQPLGNGVYNIRVSEDADSITVNSTGIVEGSTRELEAIFERAMLPEVFTKALSSGTDVDLSGASSFWIFDSWVIVNGPVSANSNIILGDRVEINGPQTEFAGLAFPDFPDVSNDENNDGIVDEQDAFITYYKAITPDDNEFVGDQTFGPGGGLDTIAVGENIVFVEGDVDILLNAQWWGRGAQDLTIAATGDINIALPVNNADDRINLFSYGNVSTVGLGIGESVNATIYAYDSFYAYWGGEINGSIVANDIIYAHTETGFAGDRVINYDDRIETDIPLGLPPAPGVGSGVGKMKSWRQL